MRGKRRRAWRKTNYIEIVIENNSIRNLLFANKALL